MLFESRSVQHPVRYKIINPDEYIELGQQAIISVRVSSASNVVIVPINAVYRGDTTGDYVYVYNGTQLEIQPVRVGLRTTTSCEIRSGLNGGETILVR